jgi:hypothetical protein
MQASFVVIDDFYPDPSKVREDALKRPFASARSHYGFNGLLAKLPIPAKRKVMAKICRLVDLELEYDLAKQADFKCLTRKDFRRKKSVVHYDLHDWSGVLSLSPPRRKKSFTTFWTHLPTKLEGFHDLEAMTAACRRLACSAADLAELIDTHSASSDKWIETSRIEHAFNRLILFRGNMFHSASDGFGTNIHNAKLTQTFFCDVKEASSS